MVAEVRKMISKIINSGDTITIWIEKRKKAWVLLSKEGNRKSEIASYHDTEREARYCAEILARNVYLDEEEPKKRLFSTEA